MKTTSKHGRASNAKQTGKRGQSQASKRQLSENDLKHVAGGARRLSPRGRAASKVYDTQIDVTSLKVY